MLRPLIAAIITVLPSIGAATCDFATSKYSAEMQKPETVQGIDIEIGKSKKWAVNGIRMIIDNQKNIHPKFKKKFSAIVTVTYPFGTCAHPADVRQSGDWRDHLELVNGKLRQSLDMKLEAGNIANAVAFKLFLPETRLGNNETLATMILRRLDILASKTFMVDVSVNGMRSAYLFQEKESKELLEAMGRREGPMFEGDEELLWSYEDFENFELEPVSTSRLVNDKWARRGQSSALMAFNAYRELQYQYVRFSALNATAIGNFYLLDPNERLAPSMTFPEYHAIVGAIRGMHSLRPHNRKFYWNALAGEFEPLYYDGNVNFEPFAPEVVFRNKPVEAALFRDHLKRVDFGRLKARLTAMQDDDFIRDFAALAKLSLEDAEAFVAPRIQQVLNGLDEWAAFAAEEPDGDVPNISYLPARDALLAKSADFGVDQHFVKPDPNGAASGFAFECLAVASCGVPLLDVPQVVKLMADQTYEDRRIVILPTGDASGSQETFAEAQTEAFTIRHSIGATVAYDAGSRELTLTQSRSDDWFLIRNAGVKDMTVSLVGLPSEDGAEEGEQRFNEFGLTGCLTFYKVTFDNAVLRTSDGACEDGLNIVSSTGTIREMEIRNGFADAIDMDFSDIRIGRISVDAAGNDCFDVSGGTYVFEHALLTRCGDKGISVGENSRVTGERVYIDTAVIGSSSKDYSTFSVREFTAKNVETCLEAFQKKEEFGGATITIETDNCDRSTIAQDENSTIILGGQRLELSN